MPKVVVISGFYNRGELLERTVQSIMDQSFADFELMVFDDASKDDTALRLQELANRYPDGRFRFKVFPENRGFVRGLIDTIADTDSEYIAIQGSGDASLPERLALQAAFLDEHPEVGAVGGWYYNVLEDGSRRFRQPDAGPATHESLLRGNVFSHGEVMFRRDVYERVGGYRPQFTYSQDYDLWLRMVQVARLATVQAPIYERYVQFDGVSYKPSTKIGQARLSAIARKLSRLDPEEQARQLELMTERGPEALVPLSDPGLQKSITQAVIRSIMFGAYDNAADLIETGVTSRGRRWFLSTSLRMMKNRLFTPVRILLRRILGIS